jgi:vitamin-K-epoxide reductase (warfarin-sensitive)
MLIIIILILALIGFCISLYTYNLEQKVKANPDYKPACDISDNISCTKPIKSEYANLFYVSNALVGIVYYVLIAALAYFHAYTLLLIAAVAGVLVSLVLAYLLYFKIRSLCLLCTSLYIINILILVFTLIGR